MHRGKNDVILVLGAAATSLEHDLPAPEKGRVEKEEQEGVYAEKLGAPVNLKTLKTADVAFFGSPTWVDDISGFVTPLGCSGGECPKLLSCADPTAGQQGDPSISACSNAALVDVGQREKYVSRNHQEYSWSQFLFDPCPEDHNDWRINDTISPRCPSPNFEGGQGTPSDGFQGADEWSGQVLVLRNVFVTWDGIVFNQTHLFNVGGCPANKKVHRTINNSCVQACFIILPLPTRR